MKKAFVFSFKISILSLALFFVLSPFTALSAGIPVNLDSCDYDTAIIGHGHEFEIQGGKYSVEIESGGNGYVVNGIVNDPLYTQIAYAKSNAQLDKHASKELQDLKLAEGNIALLTSMDEAICASPFDIEYLYIQPILIEKSAFYVVDVCEPETDHCWKLKIRKFSGLGSRIKQNNGRLKEEGHVARVYSLPNKEIISLFEEFNP